MGRGMLYPWMSRQLITEHSIGISQFGTLLKGVLSSDLKVFLAPSTTKRTPSMVCLHRGLNQESSTSWPISQQTLIRRNDGYKL